MSVKTFEEMNAEQRFAYVAGYRAAEAHYEISPREREDEAKRDERDFGTQEYDDDANRQDQRETRCDYED